MSARKGCGGCEVREGRGVPRLSRTVAIAEPAAARPLLYGTGMPVPYSKGTPEKS